VIDAPLRKRESRPARADRDPPIDTLPGRIECTDSPIVIGRQVGHIVLGVDIGVSGALSVLTEAGELAEAALIGVANARSMSVEELARRRKWAADNTGIRTKFPSTSPGPALVTSEASKAKIRVRKRQASCSTSVPNG